MVVRCRCGVCACAGVVLMWCRCGADVMSMWCWCGVGVVLMWCLCSAGAGSDAGVVLASM